MGILVEAPGATHHRVEHRQHQGDDDGQADEPTPEVTVSEQLVYVLVEHGLGVDADERSPGAEHRDHHQRDCDVDEEAEQTLCGHRDLGVAGRVAALADVAGSGFHGEHGPRVDEHPGNDQLEAAVDPVGKSESIEPAEVDLGRLDERDEDQDQQWDHGCKAEDRGESGAEPDAEEARNEHHQHDQRSDDEVGRTQSQTERRPERIEGSTDRKVP